MENPVCPWCGVSAKAPGAAACPACGAPLKPDAPAAPTPSTPLPEPLLEPVPPAPVLPVRLPEPLDYGPPKNIFPTESELEPDPVRRSASRAGQWVNAAVLAGAGCFAMALLAVLGIALLAGVIGPSFPTVTPVPNQAAVPPAVAASSTPSATPLRTATPASTPSRSATAPPAASASRTPATPTMTPDPKWTPPPASLAKGVPTVAVTGDTLFSDVVIYDSGDRLAYQIMGRSDECPRYQSRKGVLYRRLDGVPVWEEERYLVTWVSNPNFQFKIRADDPGLKAKQWRTYPGCP